MNNSIDIFVSFKRFVLAGQVKDLDQTLLLGTIYYVSLTINKHNRILKHCCHIEIGDILTILMMQ